MAVVHDDRTAIKISQNKIRAPHQYLQGSAKHNAGHQKNEKQ
jgi:hypothetical protein